jgi:hypothetical protein
MFAVFCVGCLVQGVSRHYVITSRKYFSGHSYRKKRSINMGTNVSGYRAVCGERCDVLSITKKKLKLRGFSPQANYTDRATAVWALQTRVLLQEIAPNRLYMILHILDVHCCNKCSAGPPSASVYLLSWSLDWLWRSAESATVITGP